MNYQQEIDSKLTTLSELANLPYCRLLIYSLHLVFHFPTNSAQFLSKLTLYLKHMNYALNFVKLTFQVLHVVYLLSYHKFLNGIHLIPKWPPFKYSFVSMANWPLWPCSRLNILLNFTYESEAIRVNLHGNKRILKWRPFWNKVY